ncbi:hypothetical protein SAY87_028518 [Trapa incisa]|uniref:Uncharacterized protein n=1 Tax=Trapa incisa TaxID=236973 RepID=A0AAN7KVU1_9MYRT|nr:hypothetical protein SAY87_028518 [Trapa incisa]
MPQRKEVLIKGFFLLIHCPNRECEGRINLQIGLCTPPWRGVNVSTTENRAFFVPPPTNIDSFMNGTERIDGIYEVLKIVICHLPSNCGCPTSDLHSCFVRGKCGHQISPRRLEG